MQISSCCTRARGMSLVTIVVFLLKTLNDGLPVHSSPTSLPRSVDRFSNRTDLNAAIIRTISGFPCRVPQQRAYNLADLMSNLSLHGTGVFVNQPTYLVLNRCDVHSGCCGSVGKSCSPSSTYFESVEVEISTVQDECKKNVLLQVEQHRKCHCKETNSSERTTSETQLPNVIALTDHHDAPCKKIN